MTGGATSVKLRSTMYYAELIFELRQALNHNTIFIRYLIVQEQYYIKLLTQPGLCILPSKRCGISRERGKSPLVTNYYTKYIACCLSCRLYVFPTYNLLILHTPTSLAECQTYPVRYGLTRTFKAKLRR